MKNLFKIDNYNDPFSPAAKTGLFILFLSFPFALRHININYTGSELQFSLLYIFPIFFVSWFINFKAGFLMAIICMLNWFSVQLHYYPGFLFLNGLNLMVKAGTFISLSFLFRSLKVALIREATNARTDGLTRVLNSRAFLEAVQQELSLQDRNGMPFTLVYLDLDDFKGINDRNGHAAGDRLLKTFAHILKNNVRIIDRVGRMGGDEFAILLKETGAENMPMVLERLRNALLEEMKQKAFPVTCSIGAVAIRTGMSADEALKFADRMMYKVKKEGKNAIQYQVA